MKRLFLVLGTAVVILPWLAGARVQAGLIGWSIYGGPDGTGVLESRNLGFNGTIELGSPSGPLHPVSGTSPESVVLASVRSYLASSSPVIALFGGPLANYSLS